LGQCTCPPVPVITRYSDVHSPWLDTAGTPQIVVKGAYLERMGFEIGMNIKVVEVGKGRIVIAVIGDLEDSVCLEN